MIRHLVAVGMTASLALSLAACSGGGSAAPAVLQAPTSVATLTPHVAPNTVEPVAISLTIPRGITTSSSTRSPKYIPPTVGSFTVAQTLSGGTAVSGTPVVVAVGVGAQCTGTTALTCTANVSGALGQDAYLVTTYASANGTGSPISVNTVNATVIAGAANVVSATLNPIVASLAWVPTTGSCLVFATCTQGAVLQAKDATGAVIVGPGSFVNGGNTTTPISIVAPTHFSVQTAGGSAAPTTLNASGDDTAAQVAYDGALSAAGNYSVTATGSGLTPATYTFALANGSIAAPSTVRVGSDQGNTSTTFAASEPGFTGNLVESDSCSGVASVSTSSATAPNVTYTVTQIGGGSCSVNLSDGHGATASVHVVSTTLALVLQ